MKGVGQILGGVAAYDSGKYTKRVMYRNAQQRQVAGVMERDKIRLASRIAEGRQLVAQGGTGFAVGTGTPLDELRESAIARELDVLTSHFNADSEATAYRLKGNQAKAEGKAALVGGIVSGAASIMEEAAKAFAGAAGGGEAGGFDSAGFEATVASNKAAGF